MKLKLLTSVLLVAILLLSGCATGEPNPSTSTPSPTATPGNTSIVENQDQVIYGKIYPDEEKTYEVWVGNNITNVSFELKWMVHELGLSLTTPSGEPYGICGYGSGPCGGTGSDCIILNPEPGKWTVHVNALDVPQSGKDYLLLVSFNRLINFSLFVYPLMYTPGEPIRITMGSAPRRQIAGGPAPTTEPGSDKVIGASVVADILMPGNVTESLILYDDGQHGDGQADDGAYSNVFTDTGSQGIYGISVTASGTANGVKFQKRDATLVWVSPPPDLSIEASDIVFSDDNPHEGESISITATIRNIGGGDAFNAEIWFYYDKRWSGDIAIPYVDIPAGGTVKVTEWWTARAGDHNIYVDVTNQCGIEEQNLSNNQAYRPIHVSAETNQ